ncbi:esterase [compost metagenome]
MTEPTSRPIPWLPLAGAVALGGAALAAYLIEAGRRGASELLRPSPGQPLEDPAHYGLEAEVVRVPTADGLSLGAWYVPAAAPTDRAIALFHGHSAARSQLLRYARFLHPHFNCLLVDFRGCGDSEGAHSSMGYFEADDVEAGVAWLQTRGMRRIGALGLSMGGAAVIRAAARNPAIHAVVTDGTFDRVGHVIAKRAGDRGYPFPRLVARSVTREADRCLGARLGASDPVDLIASIAPRPVLIVHGEADTTSPVANARRLYAAAHEPKELLVVPGAAHGDCWATAPLAYERRVGGFFRRHL